MKITKRQLRQIIKEEKKNLLEEGTTGSAFGWGFGSFRPNQSPDFGTSYGEGGRTIGHTHPMPNPLSEQPRSGRHDTDQALSDVHKQLQTILHDASLAMDKWVNDNHAVLDAAGELDDPESLTIRMDDLRLEINDLRDEAYKRR
jgi:hypothetical protein